MFKRVIEKPKTTFFLFGPRGTGKSTWLSTLKFSKTIDLLHSGTRLSLERSPASLRDLVAALPPKSWVLIDEVQKIPALLDEVHWLYENQRLQFALSGSSARKLKRFQSNLLAGRAINRNMFSLIYPEYGKALSCSQRVEWGTLPLVTTNLSAKEDILDSYIENYLRQELIEEGIIRKTEPFLRFLQIASLMNGQILNVENIARDCKVGRTTVDKYFEILIDTLIGYYLPAYEARARTKELTHPKFYFFDPGVSRAAGGLTREPLDSVYLGFQFETFILNEIRAYNHYSGKQRPLFYYGVSGGGEIDLIIRLKTKTHTQSDQVMAIEIKYSKEWKQKWTKKLIDFNESLGTGRIRKTIGVYLGLDRLKVKGIDIYPVDEFLAELHGGKLF